MMTIDGKKRSKATWGKALGGFMLVCMLFASFATLALGASGTEKLTIKENDVIYGDKGDLTALKMTSSKSNKEVWIEGGALKAMTEKNKTFGIKMDDYTLKFGPDVFYTPDWQKALDSGEPIEVRLLVDCDVLLDIMAHFDRSTQGPLGNFNFTSYGFTIEAQIYVAGKKTYTIEKFAKPIVVAFDYKGAWNRNPLDMSEKNLTWAWYDIEKTLSSSKKWTRLPSKVNVTDKTLISQAVYGCGIYLPLAARGVDNTGNGSTESTEIGNEDGNAPAPIGGVPTGHWAETDVMAMQQAKLIPGDLSGVQVDQPITRGEFSAYLVNTLRLEQNLSLAGKFTDVTTENPYYNQILTGAYHKILNGTTNTLFSPNAKITREEMAVLLDRALTNKGLVPDKTSPLSIGDANKISGWAKAGCTIAINSGLMGAKNGTNFEPAANTTWAEAIVILNRLNKLVQGA